MFPPLLLYVSLKRYIQTIFDPLIITLSTEDPINILTNPFTTSVNKFIKFTFLFLYTSLFEF